MTTKFVSIHRFDAQGQYPDLYAVAVVKYIASEEDVDVQRGIFKTGLNLLTLEGTFPKEVCDQYLHENGAASEYQDLMDLDPSWAAYVVKYVLPDEWQDKVLFDEQLQSRIRIYPKVAG